jgi:hypothetical protein
MAETYDTRVCVSGALRERHTEQTRLNTEPQDSGTCVSKHTRYQPVSARVSTLLLLLYSYHSASYSSNSGGFASTLLALSHAGDKNE